MEEDIDTGMMQGQWKEWRRHRYWPASRSGEGTEEVTDTGMMKEQVME